MVLSRWSAYLRIHLRRVQIVADKIFRALEKLDEGPAGEAFLRLAAQFDLPESEEDQECGSSKLTNSIQPHIERLDQALKDRLGMNPEDLHALTRIGEKEAQEPLTCDVTERLLRHYEVRKGLRIAQRTSSRRALSLASFANFLCDEYRRGGDLRTLSTALKVNESLYKQLRKWRWSWNGDETREIQRLAARGFVAQEQLLGALKQR